jgi:hypothetical protein
LNDHCSQSVIYIRRTDEKLTLSTTLAK